MTQIQRFQKRKYQRDTAKSSLGGKASREETYLFLISNLIPLSVNCHRCPKTQSRLFAKLDSINTRKRIKVYADGAETFIDQIGWMDSKSRLSTFV